jgi:peptidoglycan/LPS O-acetylase OafA/YrhL
VTTLAAARPISRPALLPAKRIWRLDVLRGIAILLVLGRHLPHAPDGTVGVFEWWLRCGWIGVDLFFVVSGYLLATLLLNEARATGTIRWGRFLWRRAWRLYPAYWVMLLATAPWAHPSAMIVARQLAFLQNYYWPESVDAFWGHTWSLAVEEHFYALLPFLLGATRTTRPTARHLAWVVGLVVVAVVVLRLALHPTYIEGYQTHVRLDAPALGVLLALLRHDPRTARALTRWRTRWLPRPALLALGVVGLSPAWFTGQNSPFMLAGGFTLAALGGALLVWWAVDRPAPDVPSQGVVPRVLAHMGRQCYAIYLVHQPLKTIVPLLVLLTPLRPAWPAMVVLYFATTALGAILLVRLVERPALALRERLVPAAETPFRIDRRG